MISPPSCWFSGLVLASVLCTFGAGDARADESAAKKRAQELFTEGRAALDKGDKAKGCALMRESVTIFAVANTLFNIAMCDEDEGKIAAALEHWERGLTLVDPNDPRAPVAKEHIATLGARVPRLRIVLPKDKQVSAVLLDGQPLAPSAYVEALKVEPGKHVIVVQSPDWQDRQHEVVLAERERTEVIATPSTVARSASGSSGDPPPPPP
ncbi:MAG TPA: hypothetical protein PK156_44395, partial [Polyangium sp.]|nr:hypothetical protein [Polyangium sp.]